MRKVSFSARVQARRETVWKLLVEKVRDAGSYIPGAIETKILEEDGNSLLREVRAQGMVLKERVILDELHGEVRYLLLEHPLLAGEVVNRVVPTSVQSPVAPVVLTIDLDWAPKDESARHDVEIGMPAQIQREVMSLKERAEEMEKSA